MSNSVQTAVSNGSLTLLDISFNYFDRTHVHVYFDNVEQTLGTTWSWVGSTDKRIQFSPAVSSGVVVKVKRVTPLDSARHVYSSPGNAPFNKATVDENFQQTLYASQEAQEGASLEQLQQDLDAQGNKITDLGDALLDGDAVNLKVLREYLPYGPAATSLAARIAAEEAVTAEVVARIAEEEAVTAKVAAQGILQGTLVITGFDGSDAPDNAWVHFAGRDTVGDGGGGPLRFLKGSTATANGVTIYAVPGGRLVREGWSVFGISPAWAGAKGDGLAEDTAKIQAALSAMPNGGTLRTAPGQTYLIDAVAPNSNTTITGGGTFKFKNNTAAFALILADLKSNITLDGVVFDGNIANQATWSEFRHCVQILGSAGVTVRNCTFQNIIGDGVYIGVSGATLPSDVQVFNNRYIGDNTNRNGVSIVAGYDLNIYGNHFYKMARPDMPGAVDIEPNVSTSTIFNVNVYGNTFVGNATPGLQKAVSIINAQSADVYNVNIYGNTIKDGFYFGIAVFGDNVTHSKTRVNVYGNTITSTISLANSCGIIASQACDVNVSENTVDTTCDIGIKALTSGFKFSSNKVKNAVKYGIEALGGVNQGMINGNRIEDCGNSSFAAYGGIHLQGSYIDITDNKIISSATTKTQTGIYIESGVKNFVDGNTIRGVGVRALNFAVAPQVLGQNVYNGGFNSVSGTYPPATETWVAGDRIYHANPTAGGFIGWVCTTAGTPGTWKTFGAISA